MQKTKLIMKIDSYSNGKLSLSVEDWGVKANLKGQIDLCNKNYSGYVKLEMSAPYKSRTTGPGSQNNKIWLLITAIAEEIGEDIKDVEKDLKIKAISKGYPYHVSKITGQPVPESMTKIDTVQMSCLIGTALEVCAFLGINTEV